MARRSSATGFAALAARASASRSRPRAVSVALAALALLPGSLATDADAFDWERDCVVLRNGKEVRGVVLQSFDPDHVLLLCEGNRRQEIPRAEIGHVSMLRDRLAAFLRVRRPGLALEAEWQLVQDAQRAGLARMARLQAYHVLLRDPEHRPAHEFLGHEPAKDGWLWPLDGKQLEREDFVARSAEWNHRLVLDSEHFTLETDCGLRRGLEVLFDLEGLYVWWMEHLGPSLLAAEDVDDPAERMTFLVHRSAEDGSFQKLTSDREPYYDPSDGSSGMNPCFNRVHTYYADGNDGGGDRPVRLFELGTEILMYSTLVLGRTLDEADYKLRWLSHWAEIGLGYWIARHCAGAPGYPEIAPPFVQPFALDPVTARASAAEIRGPHLLSKGRSELANLVALPHFELEGHEENVPLARARCATFVSFLLETNEPLRSDAPLSNGGRAAFWRYLREVYCTQEANSDSAFDAGLEGGEVKRFEKPWKAWTATFVR